MPDNKIKPKWIPSAYRQDTNKGEPKETVAANTQKTASSLKKNSRTKSLKRKPSSKSNKF
jgi:hypothetical protein